MSIEAEIEAHVAAITEAYRETITGPDAQIEGGSRLWGQFEDAVAAWRAKPSPQRVLAIIERVNELTVVGLFIKHDSIVKLEYEPRQAGLEGRIDFRLGLDMGKAAHAEVKTVQPQTDDSDENWEKYEERREHFTPGTNLIVQKKMDVRAAFWAVFLSPGCLHALHVGVRGKAAAAQSPRAWASIP
ncbi:hypothetical protein NLM33_26220 [Bradyrhizobium sp. CCGUVB1N3]|uniref:hypothetical protein n=1 Tax=Bradyrhizobium sp. CCGUVB1N3 TaxID=2949629 RepID=UPI0020B32A62|nr:hypothetical protein [Bradyrhizobium sp. CCGUVB1N3]MCP3473815.1 hypothetical protein [Bradyrhizobium sp. CCGUVB1N3]